MAVKPQKPRLGPERRSALGILADAPHGLTEAMLLARGFTTELLAGLVSRRARDRAARIREGGRGACRGCSRQDHGRRPKRRSKGDARGNLQLSPNCRGKESPSMSDALSRIINRLRITVKV
jgi:hypothetical protein